MTIPVEPANLPETSIRRHRIRPGETLADIAEHYYGDRELWHEVYKHNVALIPSVNVLTPGVELAIPYLFRTVGQRFFDWMRTG